MKNRQAIVAFVAVLILIAGTALTLGRLQGIQRLGVPGVKVMAQAVHRDDGVLIGTNAVALPERVLDFESTELPVPMQVSDWLPKDTTYAQRQYIAPEKALVGGQCVIQASAVLMGADRTSIHKPEYCLAGQGFKTQRVEHDTVLIREPHPYYLPLLKMVVSHEAKKPDGTPVVTGAVYVFWFVADGELTADHNQRMWWMARDLVTTGVLQRWAYVSCFSRCLLGQEEMAYARIKQWIAAAVPKFQLTAGPALTEDDTI